MKSVNGKKNNGTDAKLTIKSGVEDNKIIGVWLQKNFQGLDTCACSLMSESLKQLYFIN